MACYRKLLPFFSYFLPQTSDYHLKKKRDCCIVTLIKSYILHLTSLNGYILLIVNRVVKSWGKKKKKPQHPE